MLATELLDIILDGKQGHDRIANNFKVNVLVFIHR
jgi:hypothetical protein